MVALGGPLFGDVGVEMTFENGALSYTQDALTVTLALQSDGLLRLMVNNTSESLTLYLIGNYVEGISPAAE